MLGSVTQVKHKLRDTSTLIFVGYFYEILIDGSISSIQNGSLLEALSDGDLINKSFGGHTITQKLCNN